jgi:hypothetical protein
MSSIEGTTARASQRDRIFRYGALALASAALLATSAPPEYHYSFFVEGATTHIELTETKPSALVRITARANALGLDRKPTTQNAFVSLHGSVLSAGVAEGSTPFVEVRWGGGPADGGTETLNVVTNFTLHDYLRFEGDCATFADDDPCEAEVTLELARGDEGEGGGVVAVDVEHNMASSYPKGESPSARGTAPWTVEVIVE